ncbi:MAG: 30S ribosomal protein S4 [Candidatus Schekmanbacteria bacterium]|nr:MAG: 30S ribosomal protein S4 [Candidatus Schekmanbacteria bacterium]
MARYRGPVCRLCRREGLKLFLKGEKCFTSCVFEKRGFPPGQRSRFARPKYSDYGIQLREKQKVKSIYGVLERQFRNYFYMAERQKGITGENLLILLERRLDNVVHRMKFADSLPQARQLVTHGHFLVNKKKVNIPSYLVKAGDTIEVREKSRNLAIFNREGKKSNQEAIPAWLEVDRENLKGKVLSLPRREYITIPIQEQLIVELYSK